MRFLLILFWTFVAFVLLLFAARNWTDVTVVLWGDLRLDIKLPLLIGLTILLTWLWTWIPLRGRLWRARREIAQIRQPIINAPAPAPVANAGEQA